MSDELLIRFPDNIQIIQVPENEDNPAAFLPPEEPTWYILYNRILDTKLDFSEIQGDVLYVPLNRYQLHDRYFSMVYFMYHLFQERQAELPKGIDRVKLPYFVRETPEGTFIWIGVACHVPKK